MSKDTLIILLGLWIAVLPFLGFPDTWDMILFAVSGLAVSVLMFLLRREILSYLETVTRRQSSNVYVENMAPPKTEVAEAELTVKKPRLPRRKKVIVSDISSDVSASHVNEQSNVSPEESIQ